ncbi:hypothetical protein [Bowmanella denitrificans]|uniref:hypothetical protein n=1 Tax=Bowmanella denitrificans TaxID=366582 RepID=UPI000C9C45C7|nr:hypothetical protein [Bowmanella denitrificans]
MNNVILILLILLNLGCVDEQRPSYQTLENRLPEGGPQIIYRDNQLQNVAQISQSLESQHASIFERSLAWYGTESDFSLAKLDGKSARQVVETVNCLKAKTDKNDQALCF